MKKSTFLSLSLLCSSFTHEVYAQEVNLDEDTKLKKYHQVLTRRPESTNLFEKFYSNWLSKYNEESLEKFLKKATVDGGSADMQIYAYFMMQRGRELEALKVLTSAVKVDDKNAQIYLDRARVYSRLLDFDKAVIDVDKALELENDEDFILKANKLKGRYLTRQGLADKAVDHWSKLAKENPDDKELIEDVIDILMGDGLYQAALDHAEKLRASTRDPYKKAIRTLRVADILQKKGDGEKALAVYKENLDIAGANSWLEREVLAQIESLFRKEENLEGLRLELEAYNKKYPQRIQITQKLANFYSEINEHKESHALYLELIKRSPGDSELKNGLLRALDKAGDYTASRDLLISMIQLLPKDVELEIQLAEIYDKLKNKEAALEHLDLYLKKSDQNVANAIRHANIVRSLSYKEEAITAFQNAVKSYPNNDEVRFSAAEYFVSVKRREEAVKLWEQLAKSKNVETVVKLMEVLLLNSEKEKALELVEANENTFKTKKAFIKSAINVAHANNNKDAIIKYSKISLQLAESPTEIDASILKFTKSLEKIKAVDDIIGELKLRKSLSDKDKFLFLSLLEISGEHAEYEKMMLQLANSDEIAALLITVRVHERRYELAEAASIMEKILTMPNGLKAIYLKNLSNLYQRYGNADDALKTAQRWKNLTPNDKSAWLLEVALFESAGESSEALEALRKGVERFEDEVEVQAKLAYLYYNNSNFTQASRIYWKLYDNSQDLDDRIRWASELAKTATEQNTIGQLVDTFSERRRSSPKSVIPIMALAEVYRFEERHEERRNLLMEATRLRPQNSAILLEIAKSDLSQGQRGSAIKVLKEAQKVDKTNTSTKRLAKLYFEVNAYQEGMSELEKLSFGKLDARGLEGLVMDLVKQQAFEEAKEYLSQHLGKFPNDGRLRFLSSVIDYEIGLVEQSFETIIELLNSDVEMNSVKSGWQIDDYSRSRFQFDREPSPIVKSVAAASSIVNYIELIGGRSRYSSLSRAYGRARNGVLPKDKEGLQLMSILHACRVLNDIPRDMKDHWKVKLKDAGIKYTEVWKSFFKGDNYRYEDTLKIYLSNLEDPVYLELASDYYLQSYNFSMPKVLYNKLLQQKETLSKRNQRMLDFCVSEETSSKDHIVKIVDKLTEDDEVDPIGIMAYSEVYKRSNNTDKKIDSKNEIVSFIIKFLEQNEDLKNSKVNRSQNVKVSFKAEMYSRISSIYERILLQSDDYVKVAELIELNKNGGINFYGRRPRQRESLLEPYTDLTSVTWNQIGLVVKNDSIPTKINFEKMVKELDAFKNPILKYLVSNSADPEGDHTKFLDEAIKDKKYKVDAWLLKASTAYRKKEGSEKIVKYLDEAKSVSTKRWQRQAMDEYLVEIAMSVEKGSMFEDWEKDEQELAQSAARRLLLGRKVLKPKEIESMLTSLDMLDEKHRYLNKSRQSIASTVNQSSGIIGHIVQKTNPNSSSGNTLKPWIKATELVKNGRKEDAVRVLVNGFVRRKKSNEYETNQIIKVAKQNGFESDILDFLNPKESISPRKWMDYYQIAVAFDKKLEKAKALNFLKGLSIIPEPLKLDMVEAIYDDSDRALNLLEGYSNNKEAFSKLYRTLSKKHRSVTEWGYKIRNEEEIDTKLLEDYMKFLRLSVDYVDIIDNEVILSSSSSFTNLFNTMKPVITRIDAESRKKHAKIFDVYDKEERELLKRISIKGLLNSSTAETAFLTLHQQFEANEKLKELEGILIKSFETIANVEVTSYRSDNGRPSQLPLNRFQFLGEMMIESNSTDVIDVEMLESLAKIDPVYAGRLRFLKSNLLISDEVIESRISSIDERSSILDFEKWDELLKIRKITKYDGILLDGLIRASVQDFSTVTGANELNKIVRSMRKVIPRVVSSMGKSRERDKQVEAFLKKLASSMSSRIGGEESIEAWLVICGNRELKGNEKIHFALFANIIDQIMKSPGGFKIGLSLINDLEYPYFIVKSAGLINLGKTKSNEIDWITELGKMKLLEKSDLVVVERIQEYDESVISKMAKKLKNSGIAYTLRDYHRESMPKTNWQFFLNNLHSNNFSDANDVRNDLVKKLGEVKDERMLSAQVTLVLLRHNSLAKFFQEHKEAINSSPDSFKNVLIDVFDLNYNLQNIATCSKYGIDLPLDKEKLERKNIAEVEAYLKIKAPITSNDWYQLGRKTEKLAINMIKVDQVKACTIIDHYIDLIKNSPDAKKQYPPKERYVSPVQVAVAERLFGSFYNVDLVHLLPVIYHLDKREDHLDLNIYEMLLRSASNNRSYQMFNTASSGHLKKHSNVFVETEDAEYADFIKAAWFIYINRSTYINNEVLLKVLKQLKSGNKKEDEFYEWLIKSLPSNYYFLENLTYLKAPDVDQDVKIFRNKELAKKDFKLMIKSISELSLRNRLFIVSTLFDESISNHINYEEVDKELVKFAADTLIEAMEVDLDYGISADLRHGLQIWRFLHCIDEGQRKRLSVMCAKAFQHGIKHIQGGGTIHRNHIDNLAAIAGLSAEGAIMLDEEVQNSQSDVVGLVTLAQSLLKNGYVNSAVKVLPARKLQDIKFGNVNMVHDEGIDKHWDALLERYKTLKQKANVAMFMTLPDRVIVKSEGMTSYHERVGKVLALAEQARPSLEGDPQIDKILSHFRGDFSIGNAHFFDAYYAKNKARYNADFFYTKISEGNGVHNDMMFDSIKHAVHRNDQRFLYEFIEKVLNLVKEKKIKQHREAEYVKEVIEGIVSAVEQLYGEGGREELVIQLLPTYRDALSLTALMGDIKSNYLSDRVAQDYKYLAKYMHDDLGKKEDFDVFFKKYATEKGNKLFQNKKHVPVIFGIKHFRGTDKRYRGSKISIPLDTKPLMLKLLNNQSFQKEVVTNQHIGGVFDYAVDQNIYDRHQAVDLINSGEIKIKEPSFEAILQADLAHIAGLEGRYADMIMHFNKMDEIFDKHPAPKIDCMVRSYRRAMIYLNIIGKKELALSIMPKELVAKMNKMQKDTHASLIAEIKEKE